jgi:hypothetical protein
MERVSPQSRRPGYAPDASVQQGIPTRHGTAQATFHNKPHRLKSPQHTANTNTQHHTARRATRRNPTPPSTSQAKALLLCSVLLCLYCVVLSCGALRSVLRSVVLLCDAMRALIVLCCCVKRRPFLCLPLVAAHSHNRRTHDSAATGRGCTRGLVVSGCASTVQQSPGIHGELVAVACCRCLRCVRAVFAMCA